MYIYLYEFFFFFPIGIVKIFVYVEHGLISVLMLKVSPMVRMGDDEDMLCPPWLKPLLKANYFVPCSSHGISNKSECNMFCLDCMGDAFCSYCTIYHKDHHVIQVHDINIYLISVFRKKLNTHALMQS